MVFWQPRTQKGEMASLMNSSDKITQILCSLRVFLTPSQESTFLAIDTCSASLPRVRTSGSWLLHSYLIYPPDQCLSRCHKFKSQSHVQLTLCKTQGVNHVGKTWIQEEVNLLVFWPLKSNVWPLKVLSWPWNLCLGRKRLPFSEARTIAISEVFLVLRCFCKVFLKYVPYSGGLGAGDSTWSLVWCSQLYVTLG